MSSYVRSGGLLTPGRRYVRSGGLLVEGRPAPHVANLLSADVYSSPPWTYYLTAVEAVAKFPDGTDRNRLYATGAVADFHTTSRTFAVTAGVTHKLRYLIQADTSGRLSMNLYNAGAYLAWGGDINPTTGSTNGASGVTLTNLGSGVYQYEFTYTIPAGVSNIEVRPSLSNASNVGSYVAAGESMFLGAMTFAPA